MKTSDAKCLLEDLGTIRFVLVRTALAALKSLKSALKSRPTGRHTHPNSQSHSLFHKELIYTKLALTQHIIYCMHACSTHTSTHTAWEL